MADVKSFRISDESGEKLKEVAKNYPSMDDTFKALLTAYQDSQSMTNSQNAAYLLNVKALCDGVYNSFRVVLEGQGATIDAVKAQNASKIDEIQQRLDSKDNELKETQKRLQSLEDRLKSVDQENSALKELNTTLKNENQALRLLDSIQQLQNKPTKRTKKDTGPKTEPIPELDADGKMPNLIV